MPCSSLSPGTFRSTRHLRWTAHSNRIIRLLVPLALFLLSVSGASAEVEQKTLKVATFVSPPYQLVNHDKVEGSSVKTLQCVLAQMNWQYDLQVYPQKRALRSLLTHKVDAVLSVSPEAFGQSSEFFISDPVALEKWFIYSFVSQPESAKKLGVNDFGRLGVILGSAQEAWLEQRGYPIKGRGVDLHILLNMLASSRFDSVLVDYYQVASPQHAIEWERLQGINLYFVKYMPKVMAFSRVFSANNKAFIAGFNRALSGCQPSTTRLTNDERVVIYRKSEPLLTELLKNPALKNGVTAQNASGRFRPDDVAGFELAWQAFKEGKANESLASVLNGPLAGELRALSDNSKGLVREIIVTDKYGFNVAVTDLTSDFYQGDEEKFQRLLAEPKREYHTGTIQFDASSGLFLVHISVPLRNDDGKLIGGLILGIDPEHALANEKLWGVLNSAKAERAIARIDHFFP